MAIWDDVISRQDKLIYEKTGFGLVRIGFGVKPALIIIDVTYNFVGDKPEPILESIKRYPYSCGEEGWKAVHQIASLILLGRQKKLPIIYTATDMTFKPSGWTYLKNPRHKEMKAAPRGNDIVDEIAPRENDVIIYKSRSSIFYGTPMLAVLTTMRVDTLLVCGGCTGGCVRASVTDAYQHGFKVAVIQECVFDRAQLNHKLNLFEMNARFADVVSVTEVKDYLLKL